MSTRRRSVGKRLPLTLAFGVLVAAAMGAACNGFFVNPTLTSLNISPSAPSVEVGTSITMQAFGVNSDGTGSYLTSGVSWSCVPVSIATCTGSGSAQLSGVSSGTVQITASDQNVTSTASGTVYITISALYIDPTSTSMNESGSTPFTVYANQNNVTADDISGSGAVLAVYNNGTTTPATNITCAYVSGASQTCTSAAATSGTYQVVATYPGSNLTATATLIINPTP